MYIKNRYHTEKIVLKSIEHRTLKHKYEYSQEYNKIVIYYKIDSLVSLT